MRAPPDRIRPEELIPMDLFIATEPLAIDLAYARPENFLGHALYHPAARLFLHKDLARIVVAASRTLHDKYKYTLVLLDGLRTVEAQEAAVQSDIVKNNPQWLEGPNVMLSGPGKGGHPRGMAVDVMLRTQDGQPVDMGTEFDEMTEQSARDYAGFSPAILENRVRLETVFREEAGRLGLPMLPLPSEWWDFRFPRSYYEQWAPLSEKDLPDAFKMCTAPPLHTDEWQTHFDKLAKDVLNSL